MADSWEQQCAADGGQTAVFPSGLLAGLPACRFPDPSGSGYIYKDYRSGLDDLESLADNVSNQIDIAEGDAATAVTDAASSVQDSIKGIVPNTIGAIFGVPGWVVALVGAGALYLYAHKQGWV